MTSDAGLFDDGEPAGNRLSEPLDACFDRVQGAWREVTQRFRDSVPGAALLGFVDARVKAGAVVYPATVFRALELMPLAAVRVVILGQDPYHGAGQAQGLAFSVPSHLKKLPPSLRNIYAEVAADLGGSPARDGDLSRWAKQGVLLLNTTLTVEDGQPHSHAGRGWEVLSDALVAAVSQQAQPSVFMLWGAPAQRKRALIDEGRHLVLTANHPSPLSARRPPQPFIGCRHFSQANDWLLRYRAPEAAVAW
ncbi:MAG TPA: uracil-DNA glycosylase [Methylibium sp.]